MNSKGTLTIYFALRATIRDPGTTSKHIFQLCESLVYSPTFKPVSLSGLIVKVYLFVLFYESINVPESPAKVTLAEFILNYLVTMAEKDSICMLFSEQAGAPSSEGSNKAFTWSFAHIVINLYEFCSESIREKGE